MLTVGVMIQTLVDIRMRLVRPPVSPARTALLLRSLVQSPALPVRYASAMLFPQLPVLTVA